MSWFSKKDPPIHLGDFDPIYWSKERENAKQLRASKDAEVTRVIREREKNANSLKTEQLAVSDPKPFVSESPPWVDQFNALNKRVEELISSSEKERLRILDLRMEVKSLTDLIQKMMLVQELEAVTIPTVPEHIEVRKIRKAGK